MRVHRHAFTRGVSGSFAIVAALALALTARPAAAQEPASPPAAPPADPPAAPPADPPADPPAAPPADPPAAPPAIGAVVRGVVVAEGDRAPQLGVTVGVAALNLYVLTNEQGQYALPIPPGTHAVRAEATGYFAREQTITVAPPAEGAAAAEITLDFALAEDRLGEVIMVVGSRTPRSRLETTVPVDVITNDVITESSHTETNQILNVVAPSFNATHLAVQDGTDHIDPATLRGLGPEHVLVLVNGRRLHQSSVINVYSGGTVGVDLNAIPTAAIARIEVLRDGAAAQYGSDAIAGVINIVLKDGVDLLDLYTMTGVTASNDGLQLKAGANTGWKLGERGFVNVTGEFFSRGRTNRAEPWEGDIFPGISGTEATDAELLRRGLTRDDFSMSVGQSGAIVGTSFLNAEYKLDDTFTLHAHGGYTYRRGRASGFYRFPDSEDRVDLRIYPNGFLPEINPRMHAWTGTAGVRGAKGKWTGDLSITHGGDSFRFIVENSLNASLGLASPTRFDAGRLQFFQTSLNLDGVRKIELRALKSLAVVAGAEVRRETYGIDAGQPESYELGPEVTSSGDPKAPGSQVFPGFRPSDASSESRTSGAVYAGIESQPTARTNVDLAGRFERYSDFGSTVIGKLAARVAVVKQGETEVALRGAASTGFRAPGLQQIWYSTIATQFVNDPVTGEAQPTEILISPNRSRVTEAFGVPRLREETSVNLSGGFTARLLGNLSLSADYYRVTMDDRVVLSGLFSGDDGTLGEAINGILGEFPGVGAAQFFVNAVDTTTNGVDIVLDYSHRLPAGSLKATAAANFTRTTVDAVRVPESMEQRFAGVPGGADRVRALFLGRYGENRLEDLLPRAKGTAGLRWDYRGFSAGARANYFGPTEYRSDTEVDGEYLDESFGAEVTVDVDLGYRIGGLSWSVGANNVFNNFPDQVKREDNRYFGSFLYSPAGTIGGAPYGIEGGFYYVRAEYRY